LISHIKMHMVTRERMVRRLWRHLVQPKPNCADRWNTGRTGRFASCQVKNPDPRNAAAGPCR
jgi:hypothetical protein